MTKTEQMRKWRAGHRLQYNAYMRAYRQRVDGPIKNRRKEVRRIITERKNIPCVDCKQSYPFYVMDFDHVRGTKLFAISSQLDYVSLETLLKEIAKCEVVCANCHRIRTFTRKSLVTL